MDLVRTWSFDRPSVVVHDPTRTTIRRPPSPITTRFALEPALRRRSSIHRLRYPPRHCMARQCRHRTLRRVMWTRLTVRRDRASRIRRHRLSACHRRRHRVTSCTPKNSVGSVTVSRPLSVLLMRVLMACGRGKLLRLGCSTETARYVRVPV